MTNNNKSFRVASCCWASSLARCAPNIFDYLEYAQATFAAMRE